MKIKIKRPYGSMEFSGYVTCEGVEFDIPIDVYMSEYEYWRSLGYNSEQAAANCQQVIVQSSIQFAHEIPIGR